MKIVLFNKLPFKTEYVIVIASAKEKTKFNLIIVVPRLGVYGCSDRDVLYHRCTP